MQSVIATRQGYDKLVQQDQATELNRAKTVQGIQDANDMIDVGGIKIPRAQAPQMISALATKQYQEGKLSNEDYMLETEKAYKTALANAYTAGHQGDVAKANKANQEAMILQQKLKTIQKIASGGGVTEADRTILGMPSPVAKPPQTYSQASTLLKNEMVVTDFMGRMQDPAAQKRYAAAEGIMSELWNSGRHDTGIVNEAREAIYRAEQFFENEYVKAEGNSDEQRKLKESFQASFGYIPKTISDAEARRE